MEQTGFRQDWNCVDQVLSLIGYIESGFQRGVKATAVFANLTAAYDTVWKDGLLYNVTYYPLQKSLSTN